MRCDWSVALLCPVIDPVNRAETERDAMTTNALPDGSAGSGDQPTTDAPIHLDLDAGPVAITPVHVGGETRFALTGVPDHPLTEDDVDSLAAGLRAASSGSAVLVDVEDYAAGE